MYIYIKNCPCLTCTKYILAPLGIKTVINQFQEVQKLHTRKGPFGRYMNHEWYSFSETNHADLLKYNVDLDSLAREMARDFYERDNCQVVYGVHQPDDGKCSIVSTF